MSTGFTQPIGSARDDKELAAQASFMKTGDPTGSTDQALLPVARAEEETDIAFRALNPRGHRRKVIGVCPGNDPLGLQFRAATVGADFGAGGFDGTMALIGALARRSRQGTDLSNCRAARGIDRRLSVPAGRLEWNCGRVHRVIDQLVMDPPPATY